MAVFGVAFIALSILLGMQLRRRMRAESALESLARTHGLTGLNNRRSLGEILELEWRRAKRSESALSLLFLDIDRFKAYNDTYGHQAGDDTLAAAAAVLRTASGVRRQCCALWGRGVYCCASRYLGAWRFADRGEEPLRHLRMPC
jgi:PleD family two-component response regulator